MLCVAGCGRNAGDVLVRKYWMGFPRQVLMKRQGGGERKVDGYCLVLRLLVVAVWAWRMTIGQRGRLVGGGKKDVYSTVN